MIIRNFFLLFFSCVLIGEIRTVDSFKDIEAELLNLGSDALVVFDIDEVLITAVDQALKTPHKDTFRAIESEFLSRAKNDNQKKLLEYRMSLTYLYPNRTLVEKGIVSLIEEMQKQGVNVMGITRCRKGRYGIIPQVEQWRKEILWKNGIDFNHGSFQDLKIDLNEIQQANGSSPSFEEGLLFGKGISKDILIDALIKRLDLQVKKVYIFDDFRTNLETLNHLQNYEVFPVEYIAAKQYLKPLSKRQARWQLYHLLESGRWYDDQDIDEMGYFKGIFHYSIPSFFDMIF